MIVDYFAAERGDVLDADPAEADRRLEARKQLQAELDAREV